MAKAKSNAVAFLSGNSTGTQFSALEGEPATYLLLQGGTAVLHINGDNHRSTSRVETEAGVQCTFEGYSVFVNSKEAKGPTGAFTSHYANVYAASNTIPADIFAQMSEA